eukprot:8103072-Ditylum_brightwellii.AAC.1
MEYGWLNKAKGMHQIAWERGLLDPNKIYLVLPDKDKNGLEVEDNSVSLRFILSKYDNFLNETAQLIYIATQLGCGLDLSPKCHPGLAGEGIEHSWGYAKILYRRIWVAYDNTKRNSENFRKLSKHVLDSSTNGASNVNSFRRVAGKARAYIMAYL